LDKCLYCYLESAKFSLKGKILKKPLKEGANPSNQYNFSLVFHHFDEVINGLEESKNYELASKYGMKNINLLSSLFGENNKLLSTYYYYLAETFLKSNDLEKAKNMYLKSIEIEESQTEKDSYSIVENCKSLLQVKDILTQDELKSIYLKAIQNKIIYNENKGECKDLMSDGSKGKCEDLRIFYEGLSEVYSKNGETEKAKEMRSLAESVTPRSHYLSLKCGLLEKGNNFENEGMIDKAIECYLESLRYDYLYSKDSTIITCRCDSMETLIDNYLKSDQMVKYVELKARKLNAMISFLGENHKLVEEEYSNFSLYLKYKNYDNQKIKEIDEKIEKIKVASKDDK